MLMAELEVGGRGGQQRLCSFCRVGTCGGLPWDADGPACRATHPRRRCRHVRTAIEVRPSTEPLAVTPAQPPPPPPYPPAGAEILSPVWADGKDVI